LKKSLVIRNIGLIGPIGPNYQEPNLIKLFFKYWVLGFR